MSEEKTIEEQQPVEKVEEEKQVVAKTTEAVVAIPAAVEDVATKVVNAKRRRVCEKLLLACKCADVCRGCVCMLSLIGETLQDEDDICGAVVSVRKPQDRIAIWSATANAEDRQKAIGRGFRQALVDLGKNEVLKYQSHADAAASGSSFQNEVYVCQMDDLFGLNCTSILTPSYCFVWAFRLYEA
ncbi:hypothetical protein BBJ28_00008857 [Nothophytophthora sp. Chile5]|nr:hypothetical protein BBJ28_00008857 [Nothophytophthora sp. Chile5]